MSDIGVEAARVRNCLKSAILEGIRTVGARNNTYPRDKDQLEYMMGVAEKGVRLAEGSLEDFNSKTKENQIKQIKENYRHLYDVNTSLLDAHTGSFTIAATALEFLEFYVTDESNKEIINLAIDRASRDKENCSKLMVTYTNESNKYCNLLKREDTENMIAEYKNAIELNRQKCLKEIDDLRVERSIDDILEKIIGPDPEDYGDGWGGFG